MNVPVDWPRVTLDGTKLVVPSAGAASVCDVDPSIFLSNLSDSSSPDSVGHNAPAENSSVSNGHHASLENEHAPTMQPVPITIASDLIGPIKIGRSRTGGWGQGVASTPIPCQLQQLAQPLTILLIGLDTHKSIHGIFRQFVSPFLGVQASLYHCATHHIFERNSENDV